MSEAKPVSFLGQAQLLDGIVRHCTMAGGKVAAEAHITLSRQEVEQLTALSKALYLIAPYQSEIKRMVVADR